MKPQTPFRTQPPSTHLEVEAKFAVAKHTSLPDFHRIAGIAHTDQQVRHWLSAVYYDTADLRLSRAKVTLRRRSGGKDDGWHLKLPGAMGRTEIQAELAEPVDGQYQPPAELLDYVRALVRAEPLVPIAQIDNQRVEYLLRDAEHNAVAEFVDDHVTAHSFLPGGRRSTWREWEIEVVADGTTTEQSAELIRSATQVFVGAGAAVSSSPSKLALALGESVSQAPLPAYARPSEVAPKSPAAAVIAALSENRDKLLAYDPKVRANEWDSVHQMRVATRELRSHLETFHGIIDAQALSTVEAELKELAGVLGVARDAEVVDERWRALLAAEDSGTIDETTREHIGNDMAAAYQRAHRRVVAALNSQRYLQLLDQLDALLLDPPLHSAPAPAAEPADKTQPEPQVDVDTVMAEHLQQAYDKLVKRHKKAVRNWERTELSLHEREEYFHDMRKAAKKLRYAAQAAGKSTSLKTKPLYKACKQMQEVLGDFQDSVTSRDKLLELAAAARNRGEDTFGYGLLYQRERAIGTAALADYAQSYQDIKLAFKPVAAAVAKAQKKAQKKAKRR